MSDKPNYSNLTREEVEKALSELLYKHTQPPGRKWGLVTQEEKAQLKRTFGSLIDGLGDELYWIGNGVTGKGGWELINKRMEELNNESK